MEISKDSNSIDSKNKIKEVIHELLTEIVAESYNFKVGDEVKFNGDYDGVVVKVHTSGKLKGHIDVQKKGRSSTVTLHGGNKREVRLAESISEENGANINVGVLSPGEQQLAVGLIAMFGEKEGPRVDMKSLKYFKVNYLADIISKNMKHLSSDAKKYSAKLLKKLQKSIKEDSVNESSDLNFVLDQIANSMDHYDEKEFVDHISKETKYDAKSLKKLYQSYFKLGAMDRFQMGMDINKTKKFLKKFGIK